MKTVDRLIEISSRIEHLENAAEWIAKESVHSDQAISQTATMIYAVAEDIQTRVTELVRKLEELNSLGLLN